MSSHRLSASGERPFSLSAGGGAFTAFQIPSKGKDAISFNVSGFSRIEVALPAIGNARVEIRRVATGKPRDGVQMYSDFPILVIDDGESGSGSAPGVTLCAWPIENRADQETPGGENTNLDVRRATESFGPTGGYADVQVIETIDITGIHP